MSYRDELERLDHLTQYLERRLDRLVGMVDALARFLELEYVPGPSFVKKGGETENPKPST